ncbi:MAG: hypothetical protein AB7S36_10075 [Planctomycetota bacterium]
MATINRKPGVGFSFTTIVTLIGGLFLLVAVCFPLHEGSQMGFDAIGLDKALAEQLLTDPKAPDYADRAEFKLQDRIRLGTNMPYKGEPTAAKQRLGDPIKDIAAQFRLDIVVEKVNRDFAVEFLKRAERAAANPTVWNLYQLTDMRRTWPDTFTPASNARAQFTGLMLWMLPALAIVCLAWPLIARNETGGLLTPLWQGATFATLVCTVAVAFVLVNPTNSPMLQSVSLGVPASSPSLGALFLYVAILPLGVAVLFGLGHRFWWLSLVSYVVVLLGVVIYWFVITSGLTPTTPATALLFMARGAPLPLV